jgi:hypothetical protein
MVDADHWKVTVPLVNAPPGAGDTIAAGVASVYV